MIRERASPPPGSLSDEDHGAEVDTGGGGADKRSDGASGCSTRKVRGRNERS